MFFSNFFYPGNIGNLTFPIFYYPGNIGSYDPYLNPILETVDRTIQYLLIILKTFFNGGPGGRRAGRVGGRGRRSHRGVQGAEPPGGRAGRSAGGRTVFARFSGQTSLLGPICQ